MQNILDLIGQYVALKKETGSEYSGPCIFCADGNDRFRVWEDTQRYWCRQCDQKGDVYQFCKDALAMEHNDILTMLGRGSERSDLKHDQRPILKPQRPTEPEIDRLRWSSQAKLAVAWCHEQLLKNKSLIQWLESERGINLATIKQWRLGFSPKKIWSEPSQWGFDGGKKPFFPCGLVIPHIQHDNSITGINIRRFKPSDNLPSAIAGIERQAENESAYARVRGTISKPWIVGYSPGAPRIIVESELDAILLWQELNGLAVPIAVLTAGAKPTADDIGTRDKKEKCPGNVPVKILFSLDFDQAGKERFAWWKQEHDVFALPPIKGKDVSEMHQAGVPLMLWFKKGLQKNGLLTPDALNPWIHYSILTGVDWSAQGDIPEGLRAQLEQLVIDWQAVAGTDPDRQAVIEQEYMTLWKA